MARPKNSDKSKDEQNTADSQPVTFPVFLQDPSPENLQEDLEKEFLKKRLAELEEKLAAQQLAQVQPVAVIEKKAEALEGELIPAGAKPQQVTLKVDHAFQTGMPSRPDILVSLKFKKDQVVKDPELMQILIDTGAPIHIGY